MAGTCECGNEPSGSVKCGEFLEYGGSKVTMVTSLSVSRVLHFVQGAGLLNV